MRHTTPKMSLAVSALIAGLCLGTQADAIELMRVSDELVTRGRRILLHNLPQRGLIVRTSGEIEVVRTKHSCRLQIASQLPDTLQIKGNWPDDQVFREGVNAVARLFAKIVDHDGFEAVEPIPIDTTSLLGRKELHAAAGGVRWDCQHLQVQAFATPTTLHLISATLLEYEQ